MMHPFLITLIIVYCTTVISLIAFLVYFLINKRMDYVQACEHDWRPHEVMRNGALTGRKFKCKKCNTWH